VAQGLPNPSHHPERAREVDPLVYFAVGVAWAVVALGIWRQARREDARQRVRAVSSRLLSQVFPNGVRL